MKHVAGLFERIVDRQNLAEAVWNASRGKRCRREVIEFIGKLDRNLDDISLRLERGDYSFGPYRTFEVRDTKKRLIHAPPFRDRVVHHAMIQVLGTVFESGACRHSYACRKHYGLHAALRYARTATRRALWYGKVDIRKFYDSIDHARLAERLRRRFQEPRIHRLFDALLDSYHVRVGSGLPIGALTSQYLGNFYLDVLDGAILRSGLCRSYARYMDDSFLWVQESAISRVRGLVMDTVAAIGLEVKNGGQWNRCSQGVPFLGFIVYPDRVRLGKEGRRRLRRKHRQGEMEFRNGCLSEIELQQKSTSLFAHAAHADDWRWRNAMLRSASGREAYGWH